MENFGAVSVEEHVHGDTLWVAVRARGAEWSWLTPDDALRLATHWLALYSAAVSARGAGTCKGLSHISGRKRGITDSAHDVLSTPDVQLPLPACRRPPPR